MIFNILFFISASYCTQAQVLKDSSTHFGNVSSYQLMDVSKQKNTSISLDNKPLFLFIFLSPECPLCQNYTQKINDLKKMFGSQLNVYGIVPGKAYSIKEVASFENVYHTTFEIFIDPTQKFTHYLQATITPQAILLDSMGNLIYTGAIDDWVQAQGKKRLQVSEQFLRNAIEQTMRMEEVKIKKTKVFGCKINDY